MQLEDMNRFRNTVKILSFETDRSNQIVQTYRIYPGIRQGFGLSRMISNI